MGVALPDDAAAVEVDEDTRLGVDMRADQRGRGRLAEAHGVKEQPKAVPRGADDIGHGAAGVQ